MKLMLSEDIIQIVNECGFSMHIEKQNTGNELFDNYCADLNQSTPEGEDWWENVIFDGTDSDFIKEINWRTTLMLMKKLKMKKLKNGYHTGEGGCPSSILALVEDAQWKEKKLSDLSSKLDEVLMKRLKY